MTIPPDHPDFTAASLGEASSGELAAFEAGLAGNAGWQLESDLLRQTAGRLSAALRQDPATKGRLTPEQRAAVLAFTPSPESRSSPGIMFPSTTTSSPDGEGIDFPPLFSRFSEIPATAVSDSSARGTAAVSRHQAAPRPGIRKFPIRSGPVIATAGIAAAVAWGMFLMSGTPPAGPANSTTVPSAATSISVSAASASAQGIPAITLDPSISQQPQKTGVPAPGWSAIPKKDPVLFPGSPLENPVPPAASPAIATSPPDLRFAPPQPGKTRSPEPAAGPDSVPAPGSPARRGSVSDTLASPRNPGGR